MLRYGLCAAVAAAAIASPADARDSGSDARAAAGFRVEAIGGIDSVDFNRPTDGDGFLYGLGIGYDFAAGRLRFGVEAEASDSTVSECVIFDLTDLCARAGRDLYVGGRVGGMVSPGVLLYGKAGYTSFRQTITSNGPIAGPDPIVFHPEYEGLRLGGGAEVAVGRNMFVKAEYRFSNYEAIDGFDRHQGAIGVGLRF